MEEASLQSKGAYDSGATNVQDHNRASAPPPYPGNEFPGTQYPGTQYPGAHYPGTQYPGAQYPGPQYSAPPVTMTVIPNQNGPILIRAPIGPKPTAITCQACNQQMMTRVETSTSMRTHLMAALLCVLGLWPCVCVPYCMDTCLNTDHYCSNCGAFIGTYNR